MSYKNEYMGIWCSTEIQVVSETEDTITLKCIAEYGNTEEYPYVEVWGEFSCNVPYFIDPDMGFPYYNTLHISFDCNNEVKTFKTDIEQTFLKNGDYDTVTFSCWLQRSGPNYPYETGCGSTYIFKNCHVKQNGEYVPAKAYVKQDGIYKPCAMYVKQNNFYKRSTTQ